jgi:transcriptional regulator with XRE-family HTH domain
MGVLAMDDKKIPAKELLAYRVELRGDLFRQIHRKLNALKASGFTQAKLAARLGMEQSQLSRLLRGETDIRLETLSDLARGLGCRVRPVLDPLEDALSKPKSFEIGGGRIETGVAAPANSNVPVTVGKQLSLH